jgi:rubrerythrin
MSCQIPSSNLEDALYQAYRHDFEKYKNLSAVIQDVLNQPIAPESKIHAVWFYAGFVDTAAFQITRLQTPEWKSRVYAKLNNYLKPFLNGDKDFDYDAIVEQIKAFFPKRAETPAPSTKTTVGQIAEKNSAFKEAVLTDPFEAEALRRELDDLREQERDERLWEEKGYLGGKSETVSLPEVEYTGGEELNLPVESEIKTEKSTTLDEIISDEIADLETVSDVSLASTTMTLVNMIEENSSELEAFASGAEGSVVLSYLKSMQDTIRRRPESSMKTTTLDFLDSAITAITETREFGKDYVRLSNAEGIGMVSGRSVQVLRRADGTKIEVIYDPTIANKYRTLEGTEVERLPGDQVTAIYRKDNPEHIDKKTLNLRMKMENLITGLILGNEKIEGAEQTIREMIAAQMPVDQRFYNFIRITATTDTARMNANRLNRIRAMFPTLGSRMFETTELPAQMSALEQGNNNNPVLSFIRRPYGFNISVSNFKGDMSFELTPLTDLAFVYPNNTVVQLDIENPEHVQMLKNMINYRDDSYMDAFGGEQVLRYENTVGDKEIDQLRTAIRTYKAFEMEVAKRIASTGNQNIDIRDIFYRYYDLSNAVVETKMDEGNEQVQNLGDFIDAHEGRLAIPLQDVDAQGNPVGIATEHRVPIVMRKTKATWEIVNTLPFGKRIIDANGNTYMTVERYIKDSLNIDIIDFVKKNFNTNNSVYISFISKADQLIPRVIPLVYRRNVNTPSDLVDFFASMQHAFNNASIEKGNRAMIDFNDKGWGFDVMKNMGIRPEIVILKQQGDKKTFGIRFVMLEGEGRPADVVERFNTYAKANMNIVFKSEQLDQMFELTNQIVSGYGLDKITPDMTMERVGQIASEAGSLAGFSNPLVGSLGDKYSNFIDSIRKRFDDIINNYQKARDDGRVSPGLIPDEFVNYALFDGKVLKVQRRIAKEDIRNNFFTKKIQTRNELVISPRDIAKRIVIPVIKRKAPAAPAKGKDYDVSAEVVDVDHSTPSVDPTVSNEKTSAGTAIDWNNLDQTSQDEDITNFKLGTNVESFVALSEEDRSEEIRVISALIPDAFSFVRKDDLQGMNVDGHVLGYYRDTVIYLNETLRVKGVVYHEAFHGVFRRLLSPAHQVYYLKEVGKLLGDYKTDSKGKYIQVGSEKVYASEFRERRSYGHLTDEQIKNLIYEEYLADGFASFMETNKVPKTWMEKLFTWLKKMINMFKKEGRIQNLYYDITLGKYRNTALRDATKDTDSVYSMDYKSIPFITFGNGNQPKFGNQIIPSYVTSELRDKMVYAMAQIRVENSDPDLKMNQLFNLARLRVLQDYKIENLIRQFPDQEQSIIERYGSHYENARWLLGTMHIPGEDGNTESFTWRNYTNDSTNDSLVINSKIQTQISQKNAQKFKNHVLDEFREVYNESTFDDTQDLEQDFQVEDEEQESGQQFANLGFANKAPYEGSSYFRKLFKYIPYEYTDPQLGVKRTKMVDSKLIFSTIRKITTNLSKSEIVPAILTEISRLNSILTHYNNVLVSRMDYGFYMPDDIAQTLELRDSLMGVYNTLASTTGITEAGAAVRNKHVMVMFQDVFNTVDAHLLQVKTETRLGAEKGEKLQAKEQTYRVDDIVVGADINRIRTEITERINTMALDKEEIIESINMLKSIATIFKSSASLKDAFFTGSQKEMFNDAAFQSFIDDVYVAISKFNLNIPYSAIMISLGWQMYLKTDSNPSNFSPDSTLRNMFRMNKSLLKEIKNLSYEFWSKQIPTVMTKAASRTEKEKTDAARGIQIDNDIIRLREAYIRSLGSFILKYNPRIGGSVTRDANGNLVHKYVKPTPAYVMIMKLQSMTDPDTDKMDIEGGLDALISEYYNGFQEYFMNNPMLDMNNPVVKTFLETMEVSAFAGFAQKYNIFQNEKQGDTSSFKGIDEKSFMLSMFGLFQSMRDVSIPGTNTTRKLFKRILTQYEATSTSIVVDGIYKEYFDAAGKQNKVGKFASHVVDLMKVIRQEYELMRKNHRELNDESVKRYEGYNDSEFNQKGQLNRGFTFNILADMFGLTADPDNVNETVSNRISNRKMLEEMAKQDKSWDSIVADPENTAALVDMVSEFAEEQYDRFETYLKEIGIGKETIKNDAGQLETVFTDVDLPTTGSPEQFKRNFFFNNWINSIFVNQIFDGPIAVGISSFANFYKRQKSGAAAGSNIYDPNRSQYGDVTTYRSSVLKDFVMYIDKNDLTKPLSLTPYEGDGNTAVQAFDGQSLNTIDRRMRMAEAAGQLDPESMQIMRRMRYETRSTRQYRDGIRRLRDAGIVFNSVKSVTAAFQYIKQSEHTFIRKEVSMLRPDLNYDTAMLELEQLYDIADYYAMQLEAGIDEMEMDPETNESTPISELYKKTMAAIHGYFVPSTKGPLGGFLHNLLNSMEYHRIEQVYDTNSSKRATVAPLDYNMITDAAPGVYLDLEKSLDNIPNELTYNQVGTSKISNRITAGIQQKLLLISQLDPNDKRYKAIKDDIETYQKGLAEAVDSQVKRMMRMFNTSDEKIVGKLYDNIRAGLRDQGADATLLQYFEVDKSGKPIFPPSMPRLANILVYYYFSIFNKNVFDKKTEGRKYYHVSPIMYPVMEMNGKVVKRADYKRNPQDYRNAKSRYLTIEKEEIEVRGEDGKMVKKDLYTVEVVIPRELKNVDQKFVEEYLSKFFATRIPTEDKRSMFIAKVVDYMDEAYGSGIIVPSQMHMLSGSDFDIDTLYAYIRSSYYAVDGTRIAYGNYKHYIEKYGMSQNEAKFIEYLTSLGRDDIMSDIISDEIRKIKDDAGYRKEQAYAFGELFGGKLNDYFTKNASVLEETENFENEQMIDTFRRLIATYNVLQKMKDSDLPTRPDELEAYEKESKSNPVTEVILNKVLDAKMNILSNPNVYERFLADKKMTADQAVAPIATLVKRRGLTEKDIYNRQNVYTPTALAVARSLNSESKDSLGIAASFNKGVSMLVTVGAEINKQMSPSMYTEIGGKLQKVNTNKIVSDSVQLVGALIGMFADAPKTPYHGPLHLNSTTTPILAAMLSIGVPQNAAILFQSLPIIVDVVNEYNQTYGSTYSRTNRRRRMGFNTFLKKYMNSILENSSEARTKLDATLVKKDYVIDQTSYKIIFNDDVSKDDPQDVIDKTVPISNFGYKITDKNNVSVSREIENLVIINEFLKYSELANEISFNISVLTDPMKALRPDMDRMDRLITTYRKAKKGEMNFFTKESMTKLFATYPVLDANMRALEYMDKVSNKVLIERTSMMRGLMLLFENIYGYDKQQIRKDINAFIGLQLQRATMEQQKEDVLPQIYMEMLDPENFLSGQIVSDYHDLLRQYPNNEFLKAIKVVSIGRTKNIRVLEMATSRLGASGREAAYADLLHLMTGDSVTKEKAHRIAYYGMIKAGAQSAEGGFYEILPAKLSQPMAQAIWNLQEDLVKLDDDMLKLAKKNPSKYTVELIGTGVFKMSDSAKEIYAERLNKIVSSNFGNMNLGDVITEAISKIISYRMMNDMEENTMVNTIDQEKINKKYFSKQEDKLLGRTMLEFFETVTGDNSRLIVKYSESKEGVKGISRPAIPGAPSVNVKSDKFDLFTPNEEGKLTISIPELEKDSQKQNFYNTMLYESGILRANEGYKFPLYRVNMYNQMMVLKTIDGKSLGEAFISTLAQNENSEIDPTLDLIGMSAEYEVVVKQGSKHVSPLAFSMKEGAQITNMLEGRAQSTTIMKSVDLPRNASVMKNKMYMISVSSVPTGNHKNKVFTRMDGSKVQTNSRLNKYQFVDGRLLQFPDAKNIANEIPKERLDSFADIFGFADWQMMIESPKFEGFVKGKESIFVYDLQNNDIPADPLTQRDDDITIEDMNRQIDEEDNRCVSG